MYHGLHVLPASDQCATSALPRRCVESSDTCSCSSTVACRTTFLLNTPVWLCLLVSQRDELPATAGGAAQPSPQGRHLTEANLMSDLQPGRLCEVSPWHEHQQQLWLLQLWRGAAAAATVVHGLCKYETIDVFMSLLGVAAAGSCMSRTCASRAGRALTPCLACPAVTCWCVQPSGYMPVAMQLNGLVLCACAAVVAGRQPLVPGAHRAGGPSCAQSTVSTAFPCAYHSRQHTCSHTWPS